MTDFEMRRQGNRFPLAAVAAILAFLVALLTLSLSCGSDAGDSAQAESSQSKSMTDRPALKTQPKEVQPSPESELGQQSGTAVDTGDADPGDDSKTVTPEMFAAYDVEGNLHQSSEWIGKQPVVINVWGTWCPPCRREIPELVRLYDEYHKKGVEMLGMAVARGDTPQKVESFAEQHNMKWVMLMAQNQHLYALGVLTGVPTTIFYDRKGHEVNRFVGPRDYETFKRAFESIL